MAEVFGTAASALAVIELAAKITKLCMQYGKDVSNARDDIERIKTEVTNLKNVTEEVRRLLDGPQGPKLCTSQNLYTAVQGGEDELQKLDGDLALRKGRKAMRRVGLRALKWPFKSEDVQKKIDIFQRYSGMVSAALQVDQTTVLLNLDQRLVLDKLPIAQGAAFDSHAEEHNPTCLRDTRVDLLRDINEWVQDPKAEAMFWLNGMAGTGKSTISRTLAHTASTGGFLGASFFFKRGEGDRGGVSKFFSTLAAQLCSWKPAVIPHIQAAIDADPAIFGKVMQEQIEKLIFQPLSKISEAAYKDRALLIIVDALDECEHEEDVRRFIHLFSSSKSIQSPRLKIFLTSRPELPIRLGFTAVQGTYQDLILHEVAEAVIEHDIHAFFKSELTRVRKEYNALEPDERHLPATWPSEGDLRTLAKMAMPLFIFAATVCRFIDDRKGASPQKKLSRVLEQQTKSQESKLDATYMPVLEQLLIDRTVREREESLEQFRIIIGSIVVLANPLSASALSRLLNTALDDVLENLGLLHSVLRIPLSSELPIRLLHLSFRDFLLDPEKQKSQFWIDEKAVHRRLATQCLRVMNNSLRTDICEIEDPGAALSGIDPQQINKHLRPEIQYACRYWVYHLEHSGTQLSDGDKVHNFLTRHFLHWLEALSLMNRVSESLEILATIKGLTSSPAKQLDAFFNDANRFILTNVSTIQVFPLQIYSSGLLFVPKQSVIRAIFRDDVPQWIERRPEVDDKWNNCRQTLEGHNDSVNSVAFSHDSKLVASASYDETVKIWDAATGQELQTLEGHGSSVRSVAFSHDSKLVASASSDETVKVWDAATGQELQTLTGHSNWVNSVAFSHDSKLVASASDDQTVKVWDAQTGQEVQTTDIGTISSTLSFSPDSSHLLTDVGALSVGTQPSQPSLPPRKIARLGYGISEDRSWITWHGNNLLWLPPDFRPRVSAVSGSLLTIGCASGRVFFIGCDMERVGKL